MIAGQPRVLVVDDDPVTLRFLYEAISRCGCAVTTAGDANTASAAEAPAGFDLALLDRQMPGSSGVAILAELRARGMAAPAIATSAHFDSVAATELREAGFAGLLLKPSGMAEIAALLARHLGTLPVSPITEPLDPAAPGEPLLDNTMALAAIGGDHAALVALRMLFRLELDAIARDFTDFSTIDPSALRDRLHRLGASCGFCGALALRGCAVRLERRLADNATATSADMAEFLRVVRLTSEQLALETGGSVA